MAEDVKTTEVEKHPFEDSVNAENATRSGKGTRLAFGNTRGKGSVPIKWERFDESKPDTLPTSIADFMEVSKVKDEPTLLSFLIVGYNDAQYTAASDPIAEYVNRQWDDDTVTQFRLAVRNYSKATGSSIEDSVSLIKPGVEKAFNAKKAAA